MKCQFSRSSDEIVTKEISRRSRAVVVIENNRELVESVEDAEISCIEIDATEDDF
ncbi:hypothetical protein [Maridesulfovibrio zosterae]|uniref:hypothetical protein n=1 Tax=Maridesulfovibrio zosterae TaxID=82171 RepID=UPI000407A0F5|nr:hypothetical protein [Maridesulfovibrio zosterae]